MPKFLEIKVKPVSRDDRDNKTEERKRKGGRKAGCKGKAVLGAGSCSRRGCGRCAGCTVPSAGCGRRGPGPDPALPGEQPCCSPALGPRRALGTPHPIPLLCSRGQQQLPRQWDTLPAARLPDATSGGQGVSLVLTCPAPPQQATARGHDSCLCLPVRRVYGCKGAETERGPRGCSPSLSPLMPAWGPAHAQCGDVPGQKAQWARGEGRHLKPGKVDFTGRVDEEPRKAHLAAGGSRCFTCCCHVCTQNPMKLPGWLPGEQSRAMLFPTS